uniref:LAM_G_DOMAIN domain-containing protein n=1 Tax=Mesocestoides corti TaxID=53468 RepID=A0A5K3EYG3_MESCO
MVGQMPFEGDFGLAAMSISPQLYLSKESVLHLRLSAYVVLERSGTAYRLINYRNNSALALSENGQYGYVYHFNCRGLINIHHEKLSITFDKERQILLRTEKPSFVKKENEYYRLTMHHWAPCRPVSMDFFDRDRTPEILKKSGSDRATDEAKLMDLINSSVIQREPSGLTSDARIEQRLNGDVNLSWMHGYQANSLVVSPLTGGVSLSTKNLEIIATPKNDIYISFADFFVHAEAQQMTVSSGAVSGRPNYPKCHPCLLKLVNSHAENQNVPQYCPYVNHAQGSPPQSGNRHGVNGRHEGGGGGLNNGKGGSGINAPPTETPATPGCTLETEEIAGSSCESSCASVSHPTDAVPSTAVKMS